MGKRRDGVVRRHCESRDDDELQDGDGPPDKGWATMSDGPQVACLAMSDPGSPLLLQFRW